MKKLLTLLVSTSLICFSCNTIEDSGTAIFDRYAVLSDDAHLPVTVAGNIDSRVLILVLHGGPGGSALAYKDGIPAFSSALESDYAMAYYDQRSSGISSGKFRKLDRLNMNQHVVDLKRVISSLRFRYGDDLKIFLMGHSWGGTLGTAYLLEPESQNEVSGWIEIDGAHDFNGTSELIQNFKSVGDSMIQLDLSVSFWEEVLDFVNDLDPSNVSSNDLSVLNSYGYDAESQLSSDGFLNYDPDNDNSFWWYYNSSYDHNRANTNLFLTSSGFGMFDETVTLDYTPRLSEISLPSLFIWGKYDMVVPPELGRQAYRFVSTPPENKRLVILEQSGHSPMVNETIKCVAAMAEFIEQHR